MNAYLIEFFLMGEYFDMQKSMLTKTKIVTVIIRNRIFMLQKKITVGKLVLLQIKIRKQILIRLFSVLLKVA